MMRAIARAAVIPPLVITGAVAGAVIGGSLTLGWLVVRRDEGILWLSGDEIP